MASIGIIGSGFGALAVAVELTRAGHSDLRLWERSTDIGGVWRDNTYPGAGCDVPSPLYSFSFEPNPNWSRRYALQEELHAYIKSVAGTYGITPLVQFGREVIAASYDDDAANWTVAFASGEQQTVDILISAVGQLSRPRLPDIKGIETFQGTSFHSAAWDHNFDPTGKKIAVVGAGASAIQFVPHLADKAAELLVFQRSANYIMPKPDSPYRSLHKALYHRIPFTQQIERGIIWTIMEQFSRGFNDTSRVGKVNKALAMRHLKSQVPDPELRAKLTPDYPIGCKRILFSNNYYPTLAKSHVDVVTSSVSEITAGGVRTAGGLDYDVDAIIYGTGFDAQDFLSSIDIIGSGGQKLAAQWSEGAHAYLGMYVPNFPNLFVTYGPNTNLGGGSIIYMLETQAAHMRQVIDRLEAGNYRSAEVTPAADEAYDKDIQTQLEHSPWADCNNWYRHKSGRITSNWPGATLPFAKRTKTLEPKAFSWS
ncbi:MAG: NAD(P)/FAD-dependent oxidoreductase [Kineosporiaceae bacterium]|nr:NAD(P)/FAD-dependent oxidoreductase [Aeromicrobium sp.]